MNTLTHHLTDETLQDYSAGLLNAPMETLIACHLTLCPACRQRSDLADAIGGISLNDEAVAPVNASAHDILALDKSSAVLEVAAKTPVATGTGVPNPLARLLPGPLNELPWKSFGPGMKQYNLGTQPRKEGAFKLLSLEPGRRMSKHSHTHRELTVDSEVPCISLIATDAPVKFEGLLGKVVQPFVGI